MEPVRCSAGIFRGLVCEVLERGETSIFRVYGHSMHPTIVNGDVVHVARFDAASSRPGDILVYGHGEFLCVHRLIFKSGNPDIGSLTLTTAGDGLTYLDMAISDTAVIGRVVAIERNGKIRSIDMLTGRLSGIARIFLAKHPMMRAFLRRVKLSVKSVQVRQDYSRGY